MKDTKKLSAALEAARARIASLESDLSTLGHQQASLEEQHARARATRNEAARDKIAGHLVALERNLRATQRDFEQAKLEAGRLERELEQAQQRETLATLEQAVSDARTEYLDGFHDLLEHVRDAIPGLLERFEAWHTQAATLHTARVRAGQTALSDWNPRLSEALEIKSDPVGLALVQALDDELHAARQHLEVERQAILSRERAARAAQQQAEQNAALKRLRAEQPSVTSVGPRGR